MEKVYQAYYPDDVEAAVFYTLALNASADPTDKTYAKQRKAFSILQGIFDKAPLHPGIAHYIIHNYDYPELASMALPAARKYAGIAPASAHAQHMPSHIFTRLGLWEECIRSNRISISSARCYAEQAGIKGHWDEELHGLDYLVYAYLQNRQDDLAKEQLDYLSTIKEVQPANFKVAYSFAAIPARYALERKKWDEAASLTVPELNLDWKQFPWQLAIIHFSRALGHIHLGGLQKAERELDTLRSLHQALEGDKAKSIEAAQVLVQIRATEAWLLYKKNQRGQALEAMRAAADMEDAMEKHPVTPGAVIPARELLGEMLLAMGRPAEAIKEFDLDLVKNPNRRNALAGAAAAAEAVATRPAGGQRNRIAGGTD
jgi:hypothetical protein